MVYQNLSLFYRGLAGSIKASDYYQPYHHQWRLKASLGNEAKLYCYKEATGCKPPLLLVPSIINDATIFDMLPEYSLVNTLSAQYNCYILEWQQCLANAYKHSNLIVAIANLLKAKYQQPISVLGYCFGASLLLLVQPQLRKIIKQQFLIAPPVDFCLLPIASNYGNVASSSFSYCVNQSTMVPANYMAWGFRQFYHQELYQKYQSRAGMPPHHQDWQLFHAVETWQQSGCDIDGRLIKQLYNWQIPVPPLTVNTTVIIGTKDKLIPPCCSNPLQQRNNPKLKWLEVDSGHLNLVLKPVWFKEL
ncbi:MAG: hypothetical protein AAF153_02110 [Pseudomonadota bacterium]